MDILKSNLDRRTAKNSYHIEVYNNIQKLLLICNRVHHPTAKAVGFPFSVSSKPEEKKQETAKQQDQQEKTQVQKQEQTQAQPAKWIRESTH